MAGIETFRESGKGRRPRPRVALIGFRATGKSTVGRLVVASLGRVFVDMDEELVRRFGMDIRRWVDRHGWPAFRAEEAALLRSLSCAVPSVIATGGGVVVDPGNRWVLRRRFFTVWLKASPPVVLARLQQDPRTASLRPALTDHGLEGEVRLVLREREPWYRESSHAAVGTDGEAPERIAGKVLQAVAGPTGNPLCGIPGGPRLPDFFDSGLQRW